MKKYVERIEQVDSSVNGKHVLAAMLAELKEDELTDEQVYEIMSSIFDDTYEGFIQHYKETMRENNRASRRRWEKEADKWARKIGL